MEIVEAKDFLRQPWKNGGGVTHEITKAEADGRLLWRLSMAEVDTDGPFSAFTGLSRILTVIEGDGIDLHGPETVLAARHLGPVAFSGDLPVIGRLTGGPIRDLNLIFDATRMEGSVTALEGPMNVTHTAPPGGLVEIFAVAGGVQADGQSLTRFALAHGPRLAVALATRASALLIRLAPVR
ncbi:MAG: HutD family protein [Paracoccaceae bacterium]